MARLRTNMMMFVVIGCCRIAVSTESQASLSKLEENTLPRDLTTHTLSAYDVVWNGPSAGCGHNLYESLVHYNLTVNQNMQFQGNNITLFYKIGLWPQLNASYNATPCWTGKRPCSWSPWGTIIPQVNGGVPQRANLSLHLLQVQKDVLALIPKHDFDGYLIIDWEAWRPLYDMNDDGLSSYIEYSNRLVRMDHPDWNNTQVRSKATELFNAAASTFFVETANTVRRLLPNARIGYYEHPMSNPANNDQLNDIWDAVDVLSPSIYPRSTNVSVEVVSITNAVTEALRVAQLAEDRRLQKNRTDRAPIAVLPYARALVDNGEKLSRGILASQIQLPAQLGSDGVILWGSSSDYHNNGCSLVQEEINDPAGQAIADCISNQQKCRIDRCHNHGRCVDFVDLELNGCVPKQQGTCRCDAGFGGVDCISRLL